MMIYDPDSHRRRSIRLQAFDYSRDGAYFVTICTVGRDCRFGEIVGGAMSLNAAGQVVAAVWQEIPDHYRPVVLDAFVVMPNHVHGIVIINEPDFSVGATHASPFQGCRDDLARATHASPLRGSGPQRGSLAAIVGQFKSAVTKRVNLLHHTPGTPVWQRNYYERVLRNDAELAAAREYIVNNPAQWDLDKNNPANLP